MTNKQTHNRRHSQNHVFFIDFGRPEKVHFQKIGVFLQVFAILANVDLNLRPEICKLAI